LEGDRRRKPTFDGALMRKATIHRKTKETDIVTTLKIDGKGHYAISTGIRFLDHMLELFAKHGGFDLRIQAKGDLDVDQHHTVEDTGIVLGQCFDKALGDKKGINRAGYFLMPLDESLAMASVDLSGRPYCVYHVPLRLRYLGGLQTELIEHFFESFSVALRANVHIKILYGKLSHHRIEAAFKAFARALRFACSKDARLKKILPTTKGLL